MKPLSQVEPRTPITGQTTISTSGSYYLTQNLTIASGNGITVSASNVTIDLMGFSLIGSGGVFGINLSDFSNVEIRNGTTQGFTLDGIYGTGNGNRVIGVRAISNGGNGISLSGKGCTIKENTVYSNTRSGISLAGEGNTVVGNTVYYNGQNGIVFKAAGYSFYDQNSAYDNDQSTSGYLDRAGCTSQCTAGANYFGTEP